MVLSIWLLLVVAEVVVERMPVVAPQAVIGVLLLVNYLAAMLLLRLHYL
jgi:putative effector of murein hydrolase LrgA (UPF0299 family)